MLEELPDYLSKGEHARLFGLHGRLLQQSLLMNSSQSIDAVCLLITFLSNATIFFMK